MICENSNCWYTPTIKAEYKWWDTVVIKEESCKFHPKTIVAKDIKSNLFGTRCLPEDLECNLHDSIVIWEKSILHECPFNKIFQEVFSHSNNLIWSDKLHVLFQTTEEKTYCNLQMWETREGLFILPTSKITNPQLHYLSGILTTIDQKALTDLQLSDSDYYELKNIKMIERINKRVCKLFRTDLELFRLTKSKFLKLKDDNNNQLILFSSNNAIFVPTCVDIETFFTKDKTIFCYKDIAVSFYLNDKEINGFLTEDLVLVKSSNHVDCTKSPRSFQFPALKVTIELQDNNIIAKHFDFRSIRINPRMKNFTDLNFHHSQQVINGINSIENAQIFIDGDDTLVIERNAINSSNVIESDNSWSSGFLRTLKVIGSIISSLIVLCLIILVVICIQPITKSLNVLANRLKRKDLSISFNKESENLKITKNNNGINEQVNSLTEILTEDNINESIYPVLSIKSSKNFLDKHNSEI